MNQEAIEKQKLLNWYTQYDNGEINQTEMMSKCIYHVRSFPNYYHKVRVDFTKRFSKLEELETKELESLIEHSNFQPFIQDKKNSIRYKYDLIFGLLFQQ
tara:strand:- start:210 stop:509 length:300 start_codon:yes stop_codon:yes gene_type:complete